MDFVNSISGSLAGNRQSNHSAVASSTRVDALGSQSDSGIGQQSRGAGAASGAMRSASDVNTSLMEMFKATVGEAESYLAIFEGRVKLEEEYVRGLRALSEKSRDGVARLDAKIASSLSFEPGRVELPKARLAWKEVMDNYLREIDSRGHYIETLRQGVIGPLIVYRDGQERIRKRVKDDLKTSIAAYDEMRHHTLPRAKKTYEKRCEEMEQLRLQQVAIEDQKMLLSSAGMHKEGSQASHSALTHEDRMLSRVSSTGQSDYEDEQGYVEGDAPHSSTLNRSSSFRQLHARSGSKQIQYRGGSDSSEAAAAGGLPSTSSNPSPRLGGEAAFSTSPSSGGEKKGAHFLDALRSRETWENARKEGPKKLNALLNRMREGTAVSSSEKSGEGQQSMSVSPESGGSAGGQGGLGVSLGKGPGSLKSNQTLALKNVKVKREAEEADKIYRKAVFDLETLRMRRQKTIAAAKASAIEARRELYLTCQAVWLQAEQSVQVLSNVHLSLSMHAEDVLRSSVDNLDNELKHLEARVPDVDEERISYNNFYFGECKSLLFGVSLVDYAFSRAQHSPPHLGPPKAEAPIIVRKCIRFIEERALDQPGIYRTSAKHTAIQNLAHAVERDEERFTFHGTDDEPSTVAGVLKLYLRQLPEPVLPMPWEERVRYTHERQEQIQTGFASLKGRIRRLPAVNQATLRTIIEHLAKVAAHAEQNKMNASNLSIIFGPLLLSQLEHDATSIAAAMEEDRVTEDMILYADTIFDLSRAGAPVLPFLPTTSTADKTWDLDAAEQGHQPMVNDLPIPGQAGAEVPTSSKSVETVIPSADTPIEHVQPPPTELGAHSGDAPSSIGAIPQSAEGAYMPPPPLRGVEDGEKGLLNDPNGDAFPSTASKTSALPMLDVNAQTLSEPAGNKSVQAAQGRAHQDVKSSANPHLLPTPTDAASSTPITAVSSANASLGHGLEQPSS